MRKGTQLRHARVRARAQLPLRAALAAVPLVATLLLTGTATYAEAATVSAARTSLADAPATDAALRISVVDDSTSTEQEDATVRSLIADSFGSVTVSVNRTVRSGPVTIAADGSDGDPDTPVDVVLQTGTNADDGVSLIKGVWPTGVGQAALNAPAATRLGLAVGDRVVVAPGSSDQRELILAGVWRADDPQDARWFGDAAIASGLDGTAAGPLLVSPADLEAVPVATVIRWIVEPRPDHLDLADLHTIAAAAADSGLEERIARSGLFGDRSVLVEGDLDELAARVTQAATAARAVALIPAFLTALLAVVTAAQLCVVLAEARSDSTRLIRARGGSIRTLAGWAAVETAVLAVPAAGLGGLAGAASGSVLAGGFGNLTAEVLISLAWRGALIASIAAAVTVLIAVLVGARAAFNADMPRSSPSTAATTLVVAAVASLAAALFCCWRLVSTGSPFGDGAGPTATGMDPFAVSAPAAGLLALALVAAATMRPAILPADRAAGRARGLMPMLALHTLTRRPALFTTAVLVVCLATGSSVFVAFVSGTLRHTDDTAASLAAGADVRARVDVPQNVDVDGPRVSTDLVRASGDAIDGASVALSLGGRIGADDVGIVALPSNRLVDMLPGTDLAIVAPSDSDHTAAARGIATLPEGARSVAISMTVSDEEPSHAGAGLDVTAWLFAGDGAISEVALMPDPDAEASAELTMTADLPESSGETVLFGLSISRSGGASGSRSSVALESIGTSSLPGTTGPSGPFTRVEVADGIAPGSLSATLSTAAPSARLLGPGADAPVPVVFTRTLADRLGVTTDAELQLTPATGRPIAIVVAGTADAIPGSRGSLGIFSDLFSLEQAMLSTSGPVALPNEVWAATSNPDGAARDISAASAFPVFVTTVGDSSVARFLDPAVVAMLVGLMGSLVIALVGVAAVSTSLKRRRVAEEQTLEALGALEGEVTVTRRIEFALALGFGALTGLPAGALVSVTLVSAFARAAVPGAAGAPVLPVIDVVVVALSLMALLATVALIVMRETRSTAGRHR